ncbi:MAG: LacI family DNA-binding transcriptional regulator [Opitutales bacterium]|nr:LacI family DNA-binding transcriptional regulator [Opitutales bacterium]
MAAATKARVRATAAELGYRPDPMLGALARWREAQRAGRRDHHGSAIAWVYNHGQEADMGRFAAYGECLRGGRARAEALGYGVTEFWLGPGGLTEARFAEVLQARGIRGVVLAPQARPGGALHLPWEHLSAVAIGYTLAEPALHVVSNNHFQTMTHLLETLLARGRKRIGVYLWEEDNRRVLGRAASSFQAWRKARRIPLFGYEVPCKAVFLNWVHRNRLDTVVTRAQETGDWLRGAGLGDLERASYALDENETGPGMDHNNAAIGAAAVDWVTRLVERGDQGVPELPCRMLITGVWRDARTTRPAICPRAE